MTVLSRTLEGSITLVTGATGGIGRAVCEAATAAGARVIGTGRHDVPENMHADAWLRHDVCVREDWVRVLEEVRRRFGRLDCLVNNAGVVLVQEIAEISLDQWRRVFSVNVESVLLGIQEALPMLKESGRDRAGGSSIVNVSSVAGLRGVALGAAYSASKGAVTLLTKAAAREFALLRYPIRVNGIHPGTTATRMIESIMERHIEMGLVAATPDGKAAFAARNPLGRLALPEEIAAGVVFLCSPAASFMTGAELVIDGGYNA